MANGCMVGHISTSDSTLVRIEKIVKQDINQSSFADINRGGYGALQGIMQSEKAEISIDIDHFTESEYGALMNVLKNRTEPHKIFIPHPADLTNSRFTPDASDFKIYTTSGSDENLDTGWVDIGTEFDPDYYPALATPDTTLGIQKSETDEYCFFKFEPDISDYINEYGSGSIRRITMAIYCPAASDTAGAMGYKLDYYDNNLSEWVEFDRIGYSVPFDLFGNKTIMQFHAIRPVEAFTNFNNVVSSGIVKIRLRNLLENRGSGGNNLNLSFYYAGIFVNGYGVLYNGEDSFTYRDTFTGAGLTGQLQFSEL